MDALNCGKHLERRGNDFESDGGHGQLAAGGLDFFSIVLAQLFELGDVGTVVVGYMGSRPALTQVLGGLPTDVAHGLTFNWAPLLEIRERRPSHPRSRDECRSAFALYRRHDLTGVLLDVFHQDSSTRAGPRDARNVNTELAGDAPYGRRCRNDLPRIDFRGCEDRSRSRTCNPWWAGRSGRLGSSDNFERWPGSRRLSLFLRFGLFYFRFDRRGRFRRLTGGFAQHQNDLADLNLVAFLDENLFNHATEGDGNLHRGLIGLELDDGLIRVDRVSRLDHDSQDVSLLDAFPELRQLEFFAHQLPLLRLSPDPLSRDRSRAP